MRPRLPAAVPAAVGAAAALLALSTLGLTWVRRSVEGPLGDAGGAQAEVLSGRDVAPVVAALVPGVAAVVVVGLLLRGRWRVAALTLAAVGAGVAAVASAGAVLAPATAGSETTPTPVTTTATATTPATAGTVAGAVPVDAGPAGPANPVDLWRELDEGRDPTGPA